MWPWRVKMPTQNLLRVLLLLKLMMRIMLATVCCRFGSWGMVIKLNFCSDFQHKVWSGVWSWSSGEILKLKFGQYFAADVWLRLRSWILVRFGQDFKFKLSRDTDVWLRFWNKCLIEILKFRFYRDLCKNLWYELNPRVRCAFGIVWQLKTLPRLFTSASELVQMICVRCQHFTFR